MTFENNTDEMEARISAYAFGELEGDELAAMQLAESSDPILAARVAELRAFGDEIGAALKTEMVVPTPATEAAPRGGLLRFPAWTWAAAGFAAAASVAVMVALRDSALPPGESEVVQTKPAPEPPPAPRPSPSPEPEAPAPARGAGGHAVADSQSFSGTLTVSYPSDFVFRGDSDSPGDTVAGVDGFASSPISTASASAPARTEAPTVSAPPPPAAPPAERIPATRYFSSDARRLESVTPEVRRRGRLRDGTTPGMLVGSFVAQPDSESYVGTRESAFIAVEAEPLSTFSIDVDTASYANVRRFLNDGRLPPRDAVRVEELINYFPYSYAPPATGSQAPFAATLAVASAPWAPAHRLVRVGIKGRELGPEMRPAANLVFLVDVSGSMSSENKLPLVKSSLRQLLGQLRADDRVAIVTYAGASGLALPSTPAARGGEILDALDRLESGGSTDGGMGIHLAYDIAKANFRPEGLNRVILCTDGDFNVGVTGREALLSLIREKARSRVFLTVLGFGMGNLKDGTLEMLADKGNGAYGYIDSPREARKVFVEQVEGTLATIAKDVKIQVEFNPARVASYRLIGYENRALAKEDFNNDQVDAGEVGAGHTVTALYEIVPAGTAAIDDGETRSEVEALKYGPRKKPAASRPVPTPSPEPAAGASDELLTVKIRYKAPDADVSRKLEFPLIDRGAAFAEADAEFKFATAVAAWGLLLRESQHVGATTFADVLGWAEDGLGNDAGGHRAEFLELVRRARERRDGR